jgi:hypothetical protein
MRCGLADIHRRKGMCLMNNLWLSFLVIVGFIAIIGYACFLLNRRGYAIAVSAVGPTIEFLMLYGKDASELRLLHRDSRRWVEFHKSVVPSGTESVTMVLPREACSADEFVRAKEELERQGFGCSVVRSGIPVREAILLECGMDASLSAGAVRLVLTQVFQLGFDTKVRTSHRGRFSCPPIGVDWRNGPSPRKDKK